METPWRIKRLKPLRATRDDRVLTRFPTHNSVLLLTCLACHPHPTPPAPAQSLSIGPAVPHGAWRRSVRRGVGSSLFRPARDGGNDRGGTCPFRRVSGAAF